MKSIIFATVLAILPLTLQFSTIQRISLTIQETIVLNLKQSLLIALITVTSPKLMFTFIMDYYKSMPVTLSSRAKTFVLS